MELDHGGFRPRFGQSRSTSGLAPGGKSGLDEICVATDKPGDVMWSLAFDERYARADFYERYFDGHSLRRRWILFVAQCASSDGCEQDSQLCP